MACPTARTRLQGDIAPAKRLGLRAVLVRSRDTVHGREEPDAVIEELTAVPALLDRWLEGAPLT